MSYKKIIGGWQDLTTGELISSSPRDPNRQRVLNYIKNGGAIEEEESIPIDIRPSLKSIIDKTANEIINTQLSQEKKDYIQARSLELIDEKSSRLLTLQEETELQRNRDIFTWVKAIRIESATKQALITSALTDKDAYNVIPVWVPWPF